MKSQPSQVARKQAAWWVSSGKRGRSGTFPLVLLTGGHSLLSVHHHSLTLAAGDQAVALSLAQGGWLLFHAALK